MFQGSYRDLTQFAFEQNECHSLLINDKQKLASNFNTCYSVSTQLIQILGSLILLAIFKINVTINIEKGVALTTPHRAV